MEMKTNEINGMGRKWLDTLVQDEQGRYVVPMNFAYECDKKTSDLLRTMDVYDIGNTEIVVVEGDTRGVVSLGALNAVYMAACGHNYLFVGCGHNPLYDILAKASDLLMNAKFVAEGILREFEKAGADCAIVSDVRKRIFGEDE